MKNGVVKHTITLCVGIRPNNETRTLDLTPYTDLVRTLTMLQNWEQMSRTTLKRDIEYSRFVFTDEPYRTSFLERWDPALQTWRMERTAIELIENLLRSDIKIEQCDCCRMFRIDDNPCDCAYQVCNGHCTREARYICSSLTCPVPERMVPVIRTPDTELEPIDCPSCGCPMYAEA